MPTSARRQHCRIICRPSAESAFGQGRCGHRPLRGALSGIKIPTPDETGVGYKCIPRFHPGYGHRPSLIDALTGVPGRAFLPCGSEVVSSPAGERNPCTKRAPLWDSFRTGVSSSQPFTAKNVSQSSANVNREVENGRSSGKTAMPPRHRQKRRHRLFGQHNTGYPGHNGWLHKSTAYVNICNFLPQDIGKYAKMRPISSGRVYIIFRIILCKKLSNYRKNK